MSEKSEIIEKVLLEGDLSRLTPDERLHYYKSVCQSLGLNPLTKPFSYIRLDGKLVLYALKDASEQLRGIHGVSITDLKNEKIEDVYVVTAKAENKDGRKDAATGAVQIGMLKGNALANALMKAETKAKRRVTLSICGLGIMDESELETEAPSEAVIEANVRQATANATTEAEREPMTVTKDNWGEVKVHFGKAQGEMIGKKVKDLHPNVVEWLYTKWRNSLPPSASEADFRLKVAIEHAHEALRASQDAPRSVLGPPVAQTPTDKPAKPPSEPDTEAERILVANRLIARAGDLILTPDQFMIVLYETGFMEPGKMLHEVPLRTLKLLEGDGWKTLKDYVDREYKPKVKQDEPPKKRRSKKTYGRSVGE